MHLWSQSGPLTHGLSLTSPTSHATGFTLWHLRWDQRWLRIDLTGLQSTISNSKDRLSCDCISTRLVCVQWKVVCVHSVVGTLILFFKNSHGCVLGSFLSVLALQMWSEVNFVLARLWYCVRSEISQCSQKGVRAFGFHPFSSARGQSMFEIEQRSCIISVVLWRRVEPSNSLCHFLSCWLSRWHLTVWLYSIYQEGLVWCADVSLYSLFEGTRPNKTSFIMCKKHKQDKKCHHIYTLNRRGEKKNNFTFLWWSVYILLPFFPNGSAVGPISVFLLSCKTVCVWINVHSTTQQFVGLLG